MPVKNLLIILDEGVYYFVKYYPKTKAGFITVRFIFPRLSKHIFQASYSANDFDVLYGCSRFFLNQEFSSIINELFFIAATDEVTTTFFISCFKHAYKTYLVPNYAISNSLKSFVDPKTGEATWST